MDNYNLIFDKISQTKTIEINQTMVAEWRLMPASRDTDVFFIIAGMTLDGTPFNYSFTKLSGVNGRIDGHHIVMKDSTDTIVHLFCYYFNPRGEFARFENKDVTARELLASAEIVDAGDKPSPQWSYTPNASGAQQALSVQFNTRSGIVTKNFTANDLNRAVVSSNRIDIDGNTIHCYKSSLVGGRRVDVNRFEVIPPSGAGTAPIGR